MTFLEILENLGICLAIYLGIMFLPWIFAIFLNKTKENKEELALEKRIPIIDIRIKFIFTAAFPAMNVPGNKNIKKFKVFLVFIEKLSNFI